MLRKLLLYTLLCAALYFGYAKYLESIQGVHLRPTAEDIERNREFKENMDAARNESSTERALKRRATTERQAHDLPSGH
jgi:hypothetical protein